MSQESLRETSTIELTSGRDFELLSDIVLIELEEDSPSQILYVPVKDEPRIGKVLKVGMNPRLRKRVTDFNIGVDTGIPIEHEVKPGDRIMFSKYQGMYVTWDGRPALMLHEDEIWAVL